MTALSSTFVIFLCWCFMGCGQGENLPVYEFLKPGTYFGFLSDVSRKIQFSNTKEDAESRKAARQVASMIRNIYQPFYTDFGHEYFSYDSNEKSTQNDKISSQNNVESAHASYIKYLSFRDGLNASSTCFNDTGRLIVSLMESQHWAVQFFDASGKPGPALLKFHFGFVGNYDECKSARAVSVYDGNLTNEYFSGKYCIVSLLTEIPAATVSLGVCLPSTCSSDNISSLVYDMLGYPKLQPPIVGVSTQCLTAETQVTTATVFAVLILTLVGVFVVIGTLYDVIAMNEISDTSNSNQPETVHTTTQRFRHNSSYESISSVTDKEWNRTPTNAENSPFYDRGRNKITDVANSGENRGLVKILLAFSLTLNSKKLLSTSQSSGSLRAIHGIRFLSMSWVILGHLYTNIIYFAMNSYEETMELLKRWTFLPIVNGLVSVDTFFTLSGLLTSYLTIQEMARRNTWKINWAMFYFHRFWRLTPPYIFCLVIYLGLQQYMGEGPLWSNQQPYDKENCQDNWWTNLLYVNNLVNIEKRCFGHAWYLANDMQFFVLSPLMLIPFYFSRIAGMFSCLMFLLVSWITTGALSTSHKWSTTPETLKPVPGRASETEWMEHYYVVPWCRIGPFVIGIIAGYYLALSKGRPFRMHWMVVFVGWVTAVASGFAVVYGIRGDVSGDNPSGQKTSSFYNTVHRTVWGACVSWVIIACSAGYGGPVNKLLSWSPFVVLGRLTYMSYLIHPNLLAVFFGNFGALYFANDSTMVVIYLGVLVFVNLAAFVGCLALESPMVGLEKAFIRKEKKDS